MWAKLFEMPAVRLGLNNHWESPGPGDQGVSAGCLRF